MNYLDASIGEFFQLNMKSKFVNMEFEIIIRFAYAENNRTQQVL